MSELLAVAEIRLRLLPPEATVLQQLRVKAVMAALQAAVAAALLPQADLIMVLEGLVIILQSAGRQLDMRGAVVAALEPQVQLLMGEATGGPFQMLATVDHPIRAAEGDLARLVLR
jgi:hypothetical protein